jgi:hypothetical protein
MSLPDDEAQIDAKLKETDRAIAELQKVRQDLLLAKKAFAPKGQPNSSTPALSAQPEVSEKAIEKAMKMIDWKNFKKKDGEWAFMRNRDGSLVEDLQPIVGFIDQLRKGRQLVVGKYRYEASEDKFLSRYFAGK